MNAVMQDRWSKAYYASGALPANEANPDIWRKLVRGQISDWLIQQNFKLNVTRNLLLDQVEWDGHPCTYEGYAALWDEAKLLHRQDQEHNKKALALRSDIQNWLMSQYGMNKGAAMIIINKASGMTDNFRVTRSQGIAICHAASETLIYHRKDCPEWMLDDEAFINVFWHAHAIYEADGVPIGERGQRFNKAIGNLHSIYAFTGSADDARQAVEDFEMTNKPTMTQQPLGSDKPRAKSPLTALGSQQIPGAGEKAAAEAKSQIDAVNAKIDAKLESGVEGRSELTKDQVNFKRWIAKQNELATALGVNPLLRNAAYHDALSVASFDDPKCTLDYAEFWGVWGLLDKYTFKEGDSFHYDPEKVKGHVGNLMLALKLDKMTFKDATGFDTLAKAFEKGTGEEGHIKPSELGLRIKQYAETGLAFGQVDAAEVQPEATPEREAQPTGGTGQDDAPAAHYAPPVPQQSAATPRINITTMLGIPITDIKKELDRHLPPEAYGAIKFGQMSGKTDVDGDAIRDRLDEVFGSAGVGWRIAPNPHCGRVEYKTEQREKDGKMRTWHICTLFAHTFSYAIIMPDGSIQWVDASTTTDLHDNTDEQFAYRGALTSLMKQFYKLLGGMNHVLSGEYTHVEAQIEIQRRKQQNRKLH